MENKNNLVNTTRKYKLAKDSAYYESFGFSYKDGELEVKNKEKLIYAYKKAWENRDFEINKFWTRAAYFWGFLVLIFGAYFSNISNETNANEYLTFYIICIGIIFSTAWTFVIKGSKRWQENWEIHINKLEDYVSGPLYKTINRKGKTFYSVSKINEILSQLIIVVWLTFLVEYLSGSYLFTKGWKLSEIRIIFGIIITLFFIYRITLGYGKSSVNLKKEQKKGDIDIPSFDKIPTTSDLSDKLILEKEILK